MVTPLLFCPFFLRSRVLPDGVFLIFPNFLTTILVHYICLASSCICFLFRISYVDTYPLPRTTLFGASFSHSSCQQDFHFSFGLGLSSSQSFHSSTKQWKQAAYYKATYTSSLSCFIVSALACAIRLHPSSLLPTHQRIAFGDEPLKLRHLFFFFLRAECLHMSHFHQDASFFQTM